MVIKELPENLRHSIMSILLYDPDHCLQIRNSLPIETWTGVSFVKRFISSVYQFIDDFKTCPGVHSLDIAEQLELKPDQEGNLLGMIEICQLKYKKSTVEHVMNMVYNFHREATLRNSIEEAYDIITTKSYEDDYLAKAENILNEATKSQQSLIKKPKTMIDRLNERLVTDESDESDDYFKLGIEPLDSRGIWPSRKQLFLFMAPAKKGKSWFLIHAGKRALYRNFKVCHITLEMSENVVLDRYLMAIHGFSKRPSNRIIGDFIDNDVNTFLRPTYRLFNDKSHLTEVRDMMNSSAKFLDDNLHVAEFPTGTLTVRELKAYVATIEKLKRINFDVIIVDYANIMKINNFQHHRLEIGGIYKDLRGFVMEQNKILITATQSNRSAGSSTRTEDSNISDDWSAVATCDNLITYSQTAAEKNINMARLFMADGRNEQDGFEFAISQDYSCGQFAMQAYDLTPASKEIFLQRSKEIGDEIGSPVEAIS